MLRRLREARVIFVAIAQQRVELLGGGRAVALRGAELLRGRVEVFLRAIEQQLKRETVCHLREPPGTGWIRERIQESNNASSAARLDANGAHSRKPCCRNASMRG